LNFLKNISKCKEFLFSSKNYYRAGFLWISMVGRKKPGEKAREIHSQDRGIFIDNDVKRSLAPGTGTRTGPYGLNPVRSFLLPPDVAEHGPAYQLS
jgi:hypothetical protein